MRSINNHSVSSFLVVVVLLLCSVLAHASPPKGERLIGVISVFAVNYTQTVTQTVALDPQTEETNSDKTLTGNSTVLVSDYISFGNSISIVGVSTLDVNQGILYYVTDSDEQLIWAVDINQRRLLPPMDLGAESILHLEYNPTDGGVYVFWQALDSQSVLNYLYGAFYPAQPQREFRFIANFTQLIPNNEGYNLGTAAIGASVNGAPSDLFFILYLQFDPYRVVLVTYNATTETISNSTIGNECHKVGAAYSFLNYDAQNKVLWGVGALDFFTKSYLLALDFSTGTCNTVLFKGDTVNDPSPPFAYNPVSSNLYYTAAFTEGGKLCSRKINAVPGNYTLGSHTCVPSAFGLGGNDMEVYY